MDNRTDNRPSTFPCCDAATDLYNTLHETLYETIWTPKQTDRLDDLQRRIKGLQDHYRKHAPEDFSHLIESLYAQTDVVKRELGVRPSQPSRSLGKKIALSMGIGFLSVCTIRYWINIVYPYAKAYGAKNAVESVQIDPLLPYASPSMAVSTTGSPLAHRLSSLPSATPTPTRLPEYLLKNAAISSQEVAHVR